MQQQETVAPHANLVVDCSVGDYSTFAPADYLAEYYEALGAENEFLLQFYERAYCKAYSLDKVVLDVGGGPTVYQLISASRYSKYIVFTEFLESNRLAVQDWLRAGNGCFDWTPYFSYVARLEARDPDCSHEIEQRLRQKLASIEPLDLRDAQPFSERYYQSVDIVSSAFCIEGISQVQEDFESYLQKTCRLLRKDGALVITAVTGCEQYRVGNRYFPCTMISDAELTQLIHRQGIAIEMHETMRASPPRGYQGITAIRGIKG